MRDAREKKERNRKELPQTGSGPAMRHRMIIRRLEKWEHGLTRRLYETVFTEDDAAFVDYYYQWKTKDSRIYAAQEGDEICAMVHLNPFQVYVKGTIQTLYYIVAVATQKEYRCRGLMRRLMAMAEQEAAAEGAQFLFLMPASEKIYLPLGYRFFCSQRQGLLAPGTDGRHETGRKGPAAVCRPLRAQEYGTLAGFANRVLSSQYDIFVYRGAAYYERLCAEQQAQNGSVMVIEAGGHIIGTFCTGEETKGKTEIREVIADPASVKEAEAALRIFAEERGGCRVFGCNWELFLEEESDEPLLMGKVPGGGLPETWKNSRIFIHEVV